MDHRSRTTRLALLGAVLAAGCGVAAAQEPRVAPDGGVAAGVEANNGVNTGTPGNGTAGAAATANTGVTTGNDTRVSGAAGSATGRTNATGTVGGSLQCPPEPGTVSAVDCRVEGAVTGTVNGSGAPVLRR